MKVADGRVSRHICIGKTRTVVVQGHGRVARRLFVNSVSGSGIKDRHQRRNAGSARQGPIMRSPATGSGRV